MRERDRFGGELHELGVTTEREAFEREGEEPKKTPVRKIILVAGTDFPRYDTPKPPAKFWVLRGGRKKPLAVTNGFGGLLASGACLLPSERKLKASLGVLTGSLWRIRCLRLAAQKLLADPSLQVYLYDLVKGVEERVTIEKGTLSTAALKGRSFLPLVDEDYRLEVKVKKKDPKSGAEIETEVLKPIKDLKIPMVDPGHPPKVRYYPFVSKIGAEDVDKATWLSTFAQNKTWLTSYAKLLEKDRHLSILDVYRHVEFIGKHNPYTLYELHLFGHASSSAHSPNSGTAFLNTDHVDIPGQPGTRNPLDLDARATLDFSTSTINHKLLRMAFARGAMSYVWGCNWSRPLYDILGQTIEQLKGKPLEDKTAFKFRWRKGTGGDEGWFVYFMGLAKGAKTSDVVKDGKFLRELLNRVFYDTYMQHLADVSAHCVTGGAPAVYSEYDDKAEKGAPCLLNIPMGGPYGASVNLRPILRFYAKHFGTQFNKDGADKDFGRGFVLYCPRI